MTRPAFALVACAALCGCGGSAPPPEPEPETTGAEEPPPPPPPPAPARVRLIHAAFDPSAASVGARVDGADPVVVDLAYLNASSYFELAPGEHTLGLFGPDDVELMSWSMPSLSEDGGYTVVATSADEMPVLFALSEDRTETVTANAAAVRVFHGLVGLDSIDVCLAGESPRADGVPVFTAVPAASFGGTDGAHYAEVPASGAELTVQLRTSNATACHGRTQGVAHFTPVMGTRYTLVAVGRASGRPRIDRELLVCADPPAAETSCVAVPITAR